jgi:hypothetical protein
MPLANNEAFPLELSERARDGLARRAERLGQELVGERELHANSARDDRAMCARELNQLPSEPFGVHRVPELRQALLPLANGFDERVDDCLGSGRKAK